MTGKGNRLASERSPYLLLHAFNPVDWYPWGEEAFGKAKREERPIFLSIGYSTCHWCHVMERESFEDEELAALLNGTFVCIKVDREERPDIDRLYMEASLRLTGSGGWPLTIIMTPDRIPFFAATYLPKESRGGMIGLRDLALAVKRLWAERRGDLLAAGEEIIRTMGQEDAKGSASYADDLFRMALEGLRREYDPVFGGFGRSPKFPVPHHLLFLLYHHFRTHEKESLAMVEKTLERMWQGGIYDQIGSGFHRYATDREWLLPHFEKMLYDQAFLIELYTAARAVTGVEGYGEIAQQIAAYVLRELAGEEGAFYSSEDADTGGVEGRYYLWSREEILSVIGAEEFRTFARYYRLTGLHDTDERGGEATTGVLSLDPSRSGIRSAEGRVNPSSAELTRIRGPLLEARQKRARPARDTKILADWNGYAIASLAIAGRSPGCGAFIDSAVRAMRYLLDRQRTGDGDLVHVQYGVRHGGISFASDWAGVIWGLIELYQSTFSSDYLVDALGLNRRFIERFLDKEGRGFFYTPSDEGDLPVRMRDLQDGAMPSSTSIALWNITRLFWLTGDVELRNIADAVVDACMPEVSHSPGAYTAFLQTTMRLKSPSVQVVIAGTPEDLEVKEMIRLLWRSYHPALAIHCIPPAGAPPALAGAVPYLQSMRSVEGRPTAHICTGFSCHRPVTGFEEFKEEMEKQLHV
ncbi:MAG: thioredoxin domain-containing protein [Methanomicrobiales archaeon]|nr:thioredoxin domain-containing protein [Methanomicrobiales archaeon]